MKFNKMNYQLIKLSFIINIIIILFFLLNKLNISINNNFLNIKDYKQKFDINFDFIHYENDVITEKMKKNAGWILSDEQAEFINGIIRKKKPKNCLEIGVARGGSSILILNAIKDWPNSKLISIDLFDKYKNKSIGYNVKEKFPELLKKWNLFLGNMPHIILSELKLKFDFVFLDSAHISPGEIINLIEILPFLNENAIIILHDIEWHLNRALRTNLTLYKAKIMPTQIYLMSVLNGDKIIPRNNLKDFFNIGAIYLSKNQKQYYLNYFLLLMTVWEYMPTDVQLNGLRDFIIKYYKDEVLLKIFERTVYFNKKFFKKLNNIEDSEIELIGFSPFIFILSFFYLKIY